MNLRDALAGAIAVQAPLLAQLLALDTALEQVRPRRQTFEREVAQWWLEQQAKMLKSRKPRKTQGWIRRNGRAVVEATEAHR